LLFGLRATNWLGEPGTVLGCLIVMTVWKEDGFFMIFYLAALQSMPPNLAEAAAIEGCARWTFFRRVTFPLLMPTTLFVLVNAVIGAFRMVDHVVALTGCGPNNASMLLLVMIYDVAFRYWDVAYAATLTVVLLAILGSVALIQFVAIEKGWNTHYSKAHPSIPKDPDSTLFALTLAQATFWPLAFTTLVGGLFATIGAATVRRG
jgi:sn-glycerol 3-phosphate transport system permease protein